MKRVLALVALMLVFAPRAGQAACSLAQPPNMILGTYTGAVSTSGTVNMTVTCSSGSSNYTISISGGSSGSTSNRTMVSGSAKLSYGLFRDAALSKNWGNVAGTDTYAGSGSVASVSIPVYPRMAASQIVNPGTYLDTVSTANHSFTVTATVPASCTITATNLGFGRYSGTLLTATSTLSATCTNTTPYNVGLGIGLGNPYGTHSTVTTRSMSGQDSRGLAYALFRDAARTLNWGQTVGTDTVPGTGNGSVQTLTVYGQIPANQYIAPNSYTDTIVVTLTY